MSTVIPLRNPDINIVCKRDKGNFTPLAKLPSVNGQGFLWEKKKKKKLHRSKGNCKEASIFKYSIAVKVKCTYLQKQHLTVLWLERRVVTLAFDFLTASSILQN